MGRQLPSRSLSASSRRTGSQRHRLQLQAPCGQPDGPRSRRAEHPHQTRPSQAAPQRRHRRCTTLASEPSCRPAPPLPSGGSAAASSTAPGAGRAGPACTGVNSPQQLSSDEPLPARVRPRSKDRFRAETTLKQTSFGASSQPPTSRPEKASDLPPTSIVQVQQSHS